MLRLTCLASAVFALSAATNAHAQTPPAAPTPTTSPETPPAAQQKQDVMLRAKVLNEDNQNNIVTAEGDVEVRVGDRVLRADKLIYDRAKQSMRAQGRVQIINEDGSVQFSDEFEVDEEFKNGFATRFSARLAGNATATASSAIRSDGTKNILEQVVYTGCPICKDSQGEPTWQLRARRAVLDQDTQMISYQDAVLEIKGVPILYVPYFAHPDPSSERRSGLLVPDLGISSKIGAFYEQPYYWVISPSQDLTISPMVSTEVNPLIKLGYRKRFFSGFVQADGSFTYESDFNSDGDKFGDKTWRSHLYANGQFNINQQWKWGFGVERQTDDLYDRRYDIDGEDDLRGLYASQPRQLLTQLYTTGQSKDYYVEAGFLMFQGLRAGDDDAKFPRVAPAVYAEKVFDLGAAGQIATEVSTVALFRDDQELLPNGQLTLDTARVTGSAEWGSQYIMGPGLVLSPFASARTDYYRFDTGGVRGEEQVGRFLGIAGAQLSLPMIRRGKTVDVMLEPIAMVAYGSEGANDDNIPNEDSLLIESDESNLFKPNAVTGYDLWEGGLRTALGVQGAVQGKDLKLTGLVGRRWRAEKDPAFNELSNLSKKKSDYVAAVKLDLGQHLSTGARMRFDDGFTLNRIDVDAGVNIWRLSGGARYFKILKNAQSLTDEAIQLDGRLKITNNWSATYQQARNITNKQNIRLALGVAYQDDCSLFTIAYERNGGSDRTLSGYDGIRVTFSLTGLGSVGGG